MDTTATGASVQPQKKKKKFPALFRQDKKRSIKIKKLPEEEAEQKGPLPEKPAKRERSTSATKIRLGNDTLLPQPEPLESLKQEEAPPLSLDAKRRNRVKSATDKKEKKI